jgi:hypothetical protein
MRSACASFERTRQEAYGGLAQVRGPLVSQE